MQPVSEQEMPSHLHSAAKQAEGRMARPMVGPASIKRMGLNSAVSACLEALVSSGLGLILDVSSMWFLELSHALASATATPLDNRALNNGCV